MALTAWQEQQQFQSTRDMLLAQGARVGKSTHKVFTKGRGDLRIAQPVNFALTFCEEPVFTAGLVLKSGQSLIEHLYPMASVGVYKWKQDSRGMYVGAYIWASVAAGVNAQFAGYAQRLNDLKQIAARQTVSTVGQWEAEIDAVKAEIAKLQAGSIQYTQAQYELYQAKAELQANQYQLEHNLVFEGLAIRDVNYDQMMADY